MGRKSKEELKKQQFNAIVNDYKRKNYDRIAIIVPRGGKSILQAEAKSRDFSVNGLFLHALKDAYGIDLTNLKNKIDED